MLNRRFINSGTPTGSDLLFGECFNRGEFLPSTAVDQFAGTMARWMGVSDIDLPLVFPNINTFASAHPNQAMLAYNSRVIPGMLQGV